MNELLLVLRIIFFNYYLHNANIKFLLMKLLQI